MKIILRLIITIIASLVISSIISLFLINVALNYFDRNYNRYDLRVISENIKHNLENLSSFTKNNFDSSLSQWTDSEVNISILSETKNDDILPEIFYTSLTDEEMSENPFFNFLKDRNQVREPEQKNYFKFFDTFRNRDFEHLIPIKNLTNEKAMLLVSIKKNQFLPFYIRVNSEKNVQVFALISIIFGLITLFSFILVTLLILPIINRLKILYKNIKNFELNQANKKINDKSNDEIGLICQTFDNMVDKIIQDYNEKIEFFQERQELLKNISHDFRTPLTSILGYSISLDDGMYEDSDEQRYYYKIIRKKAEYMSSLFDEMIRLSKMENNIIILNKSFFNLAELTREIIIEYVPQLENENFIVESDIPVALEINGDRIMISRVIRNLIDNVIKHGSDGKFLSVSIYNRENHAELVIKDKGKGVLDKDKEIIFKRFYKNSKKGGMGVGLSLTREIIHKHNGEIHCGTGNNNETLFTISLPLN